MMKDIWQKQGRTQLSQSKRGRGTMVEIPHHSFFVTIPNESMKMKKKQNDDVLNLVHTKQRYHRARTCV